MKSRETVVLALLLYAIAVVAAAADRVGEASSLQFMSFPVSIIDTARVPGGYRLDEDGAWRDGMGKRVRDPVVNFAGQYHLGPHSCGAGCRYYTLTDLASGADLSPAVEMFGSIDPPSRTRDGLIYVTDLLSRADSRLLVAQYILEATQGEECRERLFVLEEGRLRTISATRNTCENW